MPRALSPSTLSLRAQQWAALALDALPASAQVRLSGRPPVQVEGETLAPEVQLVLAMLAVQVSTVIVAQVVGIVFAVAGLVAAAPLTFLGVAWVLDMIRVAIQVALMVTAYPLFMRETA